MKRIILFCLTVILVIPAVSQSSHFKTLRKNQAGTTSTGFSFTAVNPGQLLKSASVNSFPFKPVTLSPAMQQNVRLVTAGENGPVFMERQSSTLKSAMPAEERFFSFFGETKELTGITGVRERFRIEDIQTDELGITHIRSVQQHKGVEIYGSQSVLHLSPQREWFTGRIPGIDQAVNVTPSVAVEEAIGTVKRDLQNITGLRELSESEKQFLEYSGPASKLVIYKNGDNESMLAYDIDIRANFIEQWKYLVDASSGRIIRKFNNTPSDGPYKATAPDLNGIQRTIDTYLQSGAYYMVNAAESMYNAATGEGIVLTLDAGNTSANFLNYNQITSVNNTWNNPAAVSAHYHATRMFKYLKTTFGRNSINGKGGNIISLVNVAEDDGSSMENAFWNGKAVFYGNGGTYFKPLAGGLDVGAHELGHGVVSNTANLEYYGQPGAINETFADIFGSMVDRDDWLLGEDIIKTAKFPSGAMRSMQDPHNQGTSNDDYWQPKHVSEMYLGTEDNAGVHINCGIGNHAYYLFAEAVTKEKAEQVFYRALTQYLTKTSLFIDLRIAVIQAAKDLYPGTPDIAAKAAEAFDKVGIYEEKQVEEKQDYETNPGQEYLLSCNTSVSDPFTLYHSSASGAGFTGLTKTPVKRKTSVTDNGKYTYFVSSDNRIRNIYLQNPWTETIIQQDPFWDNVAVSKDGKRVACISNEVDTAIYVYDYDSKEWAKYILYNPTTSHYNTNAGGVLYADALEFDHTGQYLMYDSYNQLNSNAFEDISYWDIGFIRVWDNVKNRFGDGHISKLFTSLPEKVSVGNATFSKNSANIIAFDYMVEATNEYAILGANLETGDLEIIYQNTVLGHPSFSADDKKMAFSAKSTLNQDVIGIIPLATNKISPGGNATILVNDATWPVFFSTGTRNLGLSPVANFSADLKAGKAPLKVRFLDLSVNNPTAWKWTFPGGAPNSSDLQNPEVTYNANGVYEVTLTASNAYGNNVITKTGFITVSPSTASGNIPVEAITFYPNPVRDLLYISAPRDFKISLYNAGGMKILEETNARQTDLSRLSQGIYLLEITVDDQILRHKVVKQ